MQNKEFKRHIAYEVLTILGTLALLLFVCRLWPILLLVILGIFIAAMRLLFLSARKAENIPPLLPAARPEPTDQDIRDMAFGSMQRRITELVTADFPNARWVWKTPNAMRNPDTVVIVTTNVSYEGCRQMNQSVVDRMSLVKDIELPEPEVMVQRAMAVTGCADEYLVSQMVQVVNDMADYCRKNSITDGTCGMRSLIDWVISAEISGDPYLSAKYTVISKATADEEDREALITTILDPMFAPKRKRTSA